MKDFWEFSHELHDSRTPFAVITLVSSRGHAPQDPGAKAIVGQQGLLWGTVGGGRVEARAILFAKEKLAGKNRAPELITWNLQKDIGMTCGGEVSYLFEVYGNAPWEIAVFGAGHVSQRLIRLLEPVDCRITCADPRQDWLERLPKFPRLSVHCLADPSSLVSSLGADTFFVGVSQGHAYDLPLLEEIYRHHPNAPYVGVIGSVTKGQRLRRELKERGIPDAFIEKLRCPLGLSLGNNHPAEIAISIAAELLQVRDAQAPRKS